jgi:hypothetical protein
MITAHAADAIEFRTKTFLPTVGNKPDQHPENGSFVRTLHDGRQLSHAGRDISGGVQPARRPDQHPQSADEAEG